MNPLMKMVFDFLKSHHLGKAEKYFIGVNKKAAFPQKNSARKLLYIENSHLREIIFLYVTKTTHGGVIVAVSYKRLLDLLIERDMTTAQLQQQAGFSANIITRIKRNGYISLDTIESICHTLNCGVDDILEFLPDTEKNN